jgi:hypothetical protein
LDFGGPHTRTDKIRYLILRARHRRHSQLHTRSRTPPHNRQTTARHARQVPLPPLFATTRCILCKKPKTKEVISFTPNRVAVLVCTLHPVSQAWVAPRPRPSSSSTPTSPFSLLIVHTLRQHDKAGVFEPLPRFLPSSAAAPAADLKGSEKEKLLGQRWQALSPAAKAKRKALLIPVFTCGRGGARTWVPATLEPEVTEAQWRISCRL